MRWLWLILFAFSANAQDTLFAEYTIPPYVIIDRSLCQPVYPTDAGPSGISYFAGHVVAPGYLLGMFEVGDIDDYDALRNAIVLVPPPIHRSFDTISIKERLDSAFKRIARLEFWAQQGANVIFIAEHDNYYCNAANINTITEKYGIHVNNNAIMAGKYNKIEDAWPIGKSDWFSIDSIRFYLPASLTCSKDVNIWATIDTSIVCANVPVGKGSITVITDYEMLWNMTPGHGIHFGNNANFFTAIFNELVEPLDTLYTTYRDPLRIHSSLLDTINGYQFIAYNKINPADIKPNHVIVFDRPVEDLQWPDSVYKKIKKALIIGGPQSNYFGMIEEASNGNNVLQALGYKKDTLPINKIASHFGLRFSESIVCDGNLNDTYLGLEGGPLIHRICERPYYKYEGTAKIEKLFLEWKSIGKVLYRADSTSVEILYNAPMLYDETLGCDTIIQVKNAAPANGAIMAYYKNDVFAISGHEMIYQLFQSDRIYDRPNSLWTAFNTWLNLK